ncbi:MAG: DUF983 domain-containing protein, partial [Planctomycetota bacterium]
MGKKRLRWDEPTLDGVKLRCLRRVVRHTCPQCGVGALFDRWAHLRERCNHCGLIYRREDGAELGSMYLSATVSQLFAAAVFVLLWVFTDLGAWGGFAVGAPIVLAFCYGFLPLSMALWTAIE